MTRFRFSPGLVSVGLAAAALAGGFGVAQTAPTELALPASIAAEDFRPVDADMARLGQLLFYDPILSGNSNISCGTCHHPRFATADGVALTIGEGGIGLGPDRVPDPGNLPEQRLPRHSPPLFNLGHAEFTVMFHDGRIEVDPTRPHGLRTPLGPEMEAGFASLLSAQTMFPVLSQDEMAGHVSENDVSRAVRTGRITGPGGAWDLLTARIEAIPAYRAEFDAVFDLDGAPIHFTHISDAIAAFIEVEWRADDSLFDRMLRGEAELPARAAEGMALFYGELGCATCHSGPFQTDHGFHVTGQVQFGPGKRARFEDHRLDEGRFRVTGDPDDLFAFRTPSLRNVAETAPYGHTGAYPDLATFLAAHAAPRAAWDSYDPALAVLPPLGHPEEAPFAPLSDTGLRENILDRVAYPDRALSADEIAAVMAFLATLSDPVSLVGRMGVPETVPSGLPVDR